MSNFFLHIKSGNLYKVLGLARCAKNPQKTKVIYEQMYESTLRNTSEILPKGTMWMRSPHDFRKKFAEVDPYFINNQNQDTKLDKALDKTAVLNNAYALSDTASEVLNTKRMLGKLVKHIED